MRRLWRVTRDARYALIALVALALTVVPTAAAARTSAAPMTALSAPAHVYDAASSGSKSTLVAGVASSAQSSRTTLFALSTSDLSAAPLNSVAAETALTENQIGSTTEDILANATRGKVSTAVQYSKAGGFNQANSDFDLLTRGVDVVDRGGGLRTATLSNGTKVNVRPFSSGKIPTLEIDTPGNPVIKVRY